MHHHRNPIHCILPPHLLKEIAANGSETQKQMAVDTINSTTQLRADRLKMTEYRAAFAAQMIQSVTGGKERIVYDAQNGSSLPGTVIRKEGEPPVADVAVNEAYDGSGATYDLYKNIYNRNSIDNNGLRLDSTVHYQRNYDNAFWDGKQMVYGDGDGDLFNRFTIAIDVMGHELTHGVTQYEASLNYSQQPGALNESMSDVFGSLVKQYSLSQSAADADWLIGAGLLAAGVNGVALRSMKAPGTAYNDPVLGKDPQPAHMKDYVNTISDNGGVHINSGIPNHAFYLIATQIGGNAWDKAGQIWYVTLRDKLKATSNFQDCANLTYQTAADLFGAGSLEQQAVQKGWADVGLDATGSGGGTPPPSGCLGSLLKLLGAA
ncbi:MAG TPA: M4 family metallopeptidase [Anaerolineales bacterium]|nr:M4 family metallopeptidase [Anaerolineales bacterium]